MLEFNSPESGNEKQSRTTQVRHGEGLAAMIERAATLLGVEKSVFLRAAIAKEAGRVIETSSRHVLSAQDAEAFAKALDTPPTPRAREAAQAYRRRIERAD